MDVYRLAEKLMSMSDDVWLRHASGWSVWTRVLTFPPLLLAIWSHRWIGGWAVLPVALLLVWTWLNPRVFPPPRSTDRWHSKATFGERIWLERRTVAIPDHHRRLPHLLNAVAGFGGLLAVVAAWLGWLWPCVLGTALLYAGKLWYLDRMVWLYDEVAAREPRFRIWLY
jgi:hypothetical protein